MTGAAPQRSSEEFGDGAGAQHGAADQHVGGDGPTGADRTSPHDTVRRPATDAERKALASVVRLRILRLCLYEPLTNKELAERLDRNPASVLHHVRTLVAQGFLAAGEVRRGTRGSREVPYRATGKSWNLEVGPLTRGDTMLRTFFDEVTQVAEDQVEISRLGLQLSPQHLQDMKIKLNDVLREYATYPHDPAGEQVSLFLAFHPEPA